ncbi:MAG: phosphatase PAP2 family protein [Actinomycetota bacterium]
MALPGTRILAADRRAGAALARATARLPGGATAARLAAAALSPAFRGVVAMLLASRARRRSGVDALASSVVAATAARLLRDRLRRPRPGPRADGGFPSRHAAAAVAITTSVRRRDPRLGAALAVAAAVGLAGRVAARHHDPADIAAGAVLGAATASALARLGPGGAR